MSCSSSIKKNLDWLKRYYPSLDFHEYESYIASNATISSLQDEKTVKLPDGSVVPNYLNWCVESTLNQIANPTQFLTPNLQSDSKYQKLSSVCSIIDSEERPLLDYLLSIGNGNTVPSQSQPTKASTLLVFGAHAFLGLIHGQIANTTDVSHIILVEGKIAEIAAASISLDMSDAIIQLRNNNIGFTSVFSSDPAEAKAAIESLICFQSPLILYGFKVIKSPVPSPFFANLESWLNSSFGMTAYVPYFLGNETDEINQSLHAIITHSKYSLKRNVIQGYSTNILTGAVVVTASGPSLDHQLEDIRYISSNNGTVIASGSSLGTLMRSGIIPNYAVFLEMSSQVYKDILELVVDGYSLSSITAVLSLSVDPRIPALFDKFITFQRPQINTLSLFPSEASSALIQSGPQVVNAALEFALSMGARHFILMGCDFSSPSRSLLRSDNAIGQSSREMNVPHRGLSGKTVYSSPDLLITANAFTQALSAFNALAYTTSNIVDVGSNSIQLVSSFDHIPKCKIDDFATNANHLSSAYSLSQYNDVSLKMQEKVQEMPSNISSINYEILEILRSHTHWNYDISSRISPFVSHPGAAESRFSYEIKIFRCLYFFLLHPLYLVSNSNEGEWSAQIDLLEKRLLELESFCQSLSLAYQRIFLISEKLTLDPESNRHIFSEILSIRDSDDL